MKRNAMGLKVMGLILLALFLTGNIPAFGWGDQCMSNPSKAEMRLAKIRCRNGCWNHGGCSEGYFAGGYCGDWGCEQIFGFICFDGYWEEWTTTVGPADCPM